jgi:hypothetical protein
MSKHPDLNHSYFQLIRTISTHKALLPALIELDKQYKPNQKDPIYKLMESLDSLASIFVSCLSKQENVDGEESSKTS